MLLATAAVAAWKTHEQAVVAANRVAHTLAVETMLDRFLIGCLNMQSGTRGYIISGAESELAGYEWARAQLPAMLAELGRLTADHPRQQERLERLTREARQQIAFRERLVRTARERGFAAARALVESGEGQRGVDAIRVIVAAMQGEEARTLTERQKDSAAKQEWTTLISAIVTALALGLVVVTAVVARFHFQRLRRAERSLARSYTALSEAERVARMGSWTWDVAADRVAWSPELSRIFGRDPHQDPPSYAEHAQLYTPESKARLDAAVEAALRTGAEFDLELEAIRADGTHFYLRGRGQAERDAAGSVVRLFGTSQDITAERKARVELQLANERMRLAAQAGGVALWDWDVEADRLVWDDEMLRIYGVTREEFRGDAAAWRERLDPEDAPRVQALVEGALRGEKEFETEFCLLLPDGGRRVVAVRSKVLRDPEGRPVRMLGVNADVTESRRLERELELNRRELVEAQRLAKVGSWSWDPVCDRVQWSEELYHLIGWDPSQPPPPWARHHEIYPPESLDRLRIAVERCLAEGEPYEVELDAVRCDGRRIRIKACGRAERSVAGRVTALFGTAQDITDLQRALEHEREMTRQAQAAEQAKAQFLAVMSHEIRTPMNGILGFAELLAAQPLGEEQREYINTIRESGHSLLRIIDDILDYSRLRSGRFVIEEAPFSPVRLVGGVRDLLRSAAASRGIELRTEVGPDLPARVNGDAGRLRQILINLVNNGIKFTSEGSVTLGLRRVDFASGGAAELEFFVRDTGIGIPEDKLQTIFEPFAQADNSISRRYGGTGLGLTIVKQLVALMGGTLEVDSADRRGTQFTFRLPCVALDESAGTGGAGETAADGPLDRSFAAKHPQSVLVAEDDPVNLKLVLLLLERLGYGARAVRNGLEAVEECAREMPDLILMDLHMPEMGGIEATRRIRAMAGGDAPRIIAFTADVMPAERAQCFDAGMTGYLTKPLRHAALAAALRGGTEPRRRPEDSGQISATPF